MSLNPDSISGRINDEVDRRWGELLAKMDAETAARKRELAATALAQARAAFLGFFSGLVVVAAVAVPTYGFLERAAVNAAQDELRVAMSDYANFKRVAADLLSSVGSKVADTHEELGVARAELVQAQAVVEETKVLLGDAKKEIDELYAALRAGPNDVDVARLRALLEAIKTDPELGDWARTVDLADRHEQMLTGAQQVPAISVGQLSFRGLAGLSNLDDPSTRFMWTEQVRSGSDVQHVLKVHNVWSHTMVGSRDLDDGSQWFFGVDFLPDGVARTRLRGPDKTILQHRVVDGRDPSLEVLRLGRGNYKPYQFPPAP